MFLFYNIYKEKLFTIKTEDGHEALVYKYFACLFVFLYPINVKFAEPIGTKFFCGTSHVSWEGLWIIKISKISLHQNSNVINFWKFTIFFTKSRTFCSVFVFECTQRKNVHNWIEDGSEASAYIYFACRSVCLYPMNVGMTELIGLKFCLGTHMTPGKVYGAQNFKKLPPKLEVES